MTECVVRKGIVFNINVNIDVNVNVEIKFFKCHKKAIEQDPLSQIYVLCIDHF